jgi:iron complex transport system substrate-binding protein
MIISRKIMQFTLLVAAMAGLLGSCGTGKDKKPAETATGQPARELRIVSLSGTTSEILSAIGMQDKIVGVDVTSTYPAAVAALPKVGHNRNVSAEAVIALKPTLVVGIDENIRPELTEQLHNAGIRVMLFHLESSVAGTKNLIREVADSMGAADKAQPICDNIDTDLKDTATLSRKTKVLFIYARGAGTMMVAGKHTYPNAMIGLAGGENAVNDFEDFKPLTPESLLKANPDVILMFDSGLESLGGMKGLLEVPGVKMTNAGRNKQVIEMDGQFLTGFGPRLGKAVAELSKKLNEVNTH